MNKKTIATYLEYTSERSVYKFIKDLEKLGLLEITKNNKITLIYESNRAIN